MAAAAYAFAQNAVKANAEYPEFYNGDSAKGMTRVLARCWKGGGEWGADAVLADVKLGEDARGEFVFHADRFPAGPTTIRLQAIDGRGRQDYC